MEENQGWDDDQEDDAAQENVENEDGGTELYESALNQEQDPEG